MPRTPFDPRQTRLRNEWDRLRQLNDESDTVRVEPLDVPPGGAPDRYRVTFHCKGIAHIDSGNAPVYSHIHQVLIVCHEAFPADPPQLRWETPIWHPNVQHLEPHGVCVNKAEWLAGMDLVELCRMMFEMVQYKNYHALAEPPYPLDQVVARWVREVGEPKGYVSKRLGRFVDNRPFTRPTVPSRISVVPAAPKRPQIRVVSSTGGEGGA